MIVSILSRLIRSHKIVPRVCPILSPFTTVSLTNFRKMAASIEPAKEKSDHPNEVTCFKLYKYFMLPLFLLI